MLAMGLSVMTIGVGHSWIITCISICGALTVSKHHSDIKEDHFLPKSKWFKWCKGSTSWNHSSSLLQCHLVEIARVIVMSNSIAFVPPSLAGNLDYPLSRVSLMGLCTVPCSKSQSPEPGPSICCITWSRRKMPSNSTSASWVPATVHRLVLSAPRQISTLTRWPNAVHFVCRKEPRRRTLSTDSKCRHDLLPFLSRGTGLSFLGILGAQAPPQGGYFTRNRRWCR